MINYVDSSHLRLLHSDLLAVEDIEALRQFAVHDSTTAEVIDSTLFAGLRGARGEADAVFSAEVEGEALDRHRRLKDFLQKMGW